MAKPKMIRIMVEVPENWIDIESPTLWAGRSIYDMARATVEDILIKQYIEKVTLPEIEWNKEEVKAKIIDKLAEKALNKE